MTLLRAFSRALWARHRLRAHIRRHGDLQAYADSTRMHAQHREATHDGTLDDPAQGVRTPRSAG